MKKYIEWSKVQKIYVFISFKSEIKDQREISVNTAQSKRIKYNKRNIQKKIRNKCE